MLFFFKYVTKIQNQNGFFFMLRQKDFMLRQNRFILRQLTENKIDDLQ